MALDKDNSTANAATGLSSLLDFRSKSEALKRILGLGTGSIFSSLPSGRRYSMTAPSLFGHNPANPPGLGNLNNSCYQNSIIQGLASLRSLSGFLDHNIETLGNRHAFATHLALKDIVERLNDSSNSGRQLWIPRDLKSMSTWQQQDAQEYFSKVVDQLDKEIRDGSRGLSRDAGLKVAQSQDEQSLTLKILSKDDTGKEVLEKFRSNGYSPPFVNPLEGLLAQRVGCMQCGWTEGLTLFQFNCVTVPLRRGHEFDIRQCLSDYTELELIEGVECPKCTLLRTQMQLQQMLERLESESDSERQASNRTLTDGLKAATERRLEAVGAALHDEDYSEKTLSGPCVIPRKNRVCSTKSKQAVIAKAPKSLTIHVNRSMYDEFSGLSLKNGANVRFPIVLDLDPWCLGTKSLEDDAPETWVVDPSKSMLRQPGVTCEATNDRRYELRAVVTHSGHHENGHYICFRKYPKGSFPGKLSTDDPKEDDDENSEHWFMLSDANVYPVSENTVLSQGGVFMLFYELMDEVPQSLETVSATVSAAQVTESQVDPSEANPLLDISNTPRKHTAINKQGQYCNDAGSPRATPTSETFDMSSSSSSSEETVYEENTRVGVPRVDLVMRTSSNSSTTRRGKSPSGMRSPISPVMAN